MTGLLQNKTAIVYGAAGPVGAPVAGAFARDGARVVLTGRAPGGGREAIPGLGGSPSPGPRWPG
jgi:NAD(P)-dependent dehydrogenase (short-subunit alcohol dehydrogenase family)